MQRGFSIFPAYATLLVAIDELFVMTFELLECRVQRWLIEAHGAPWTTDNTYLALSVSDRWRFAPDPRMASVVVGVPDSPG
jgi:hypothetical protein